MDSGLPNIIDSLLIDLDNLQLGADFTEEMTFTGYHNISNMTMSFRVECSHGFCGSDCTTTSQNNPRMVTCQADGTLTCYDNFDPNTSCTECVDNYNLTTNCTSCLFGRNISTRCTTCLPGYDSNRDCTVCLSGRKISTRCTTCLSGFTGSNCEPGECYTIILLYSQHKVYLFLLQTLHSVWEWWVVSLEEWVEFCCSSF